MTARAHARLVRGAGVDAHFKPGAPCALLYQTGALSERAALCSPNIHTRAWRPRVRAHPRVHLAYFEARAGGEREETRGDAYYRLSQCSRPVQWFPPRIDFAALGGRAPPRCLENTAPMRVLRFVKFPGGAVCADVWRVWLFFVFVGLVDLRGKMIDGIMFISGSVNWTNAESLYLNAKARSDRVELVARKFASSEILRALPLALRSLRDDMALQTPRGFSVILILTRGIITSYWVSSWEYYLLDGVVHLPLIHIVRCMKNI